VNLVTRIDARQYPPAVLAAAHARDLRDALNRMARYKQLCAPDEMRITVERDECVIEFVWPHAIEDEPPLLVDAAFAAVVELGRRGTDAAIHPKRLELKRRKEGTGAHAAYFGCPVKFNARRNALIMRASDLDRRFVSYNAELLGMMQPPLDKALAQRQARSSVCETVKWVLKRLLPGSSPDVFAVARELGVSGRTLQRRIADEGSSFRGLLLETRQELVRRYLTQPSIELNEVAYLLGYEDANSFYRAFRTWQRTTPAHWRAQHCASEKLVSRANHALRQ
jgi:AraC-like DNA-binding protein